MNYEGLKVKIRELRLCKDYVKARVNDMNVILSNVRLLSKVNDYVKEWLEHQENVTNEYEQLYQDF